LKKLSIAAAARPEWRREVSLRLALALLPCLVLVVHQRAVLGHGPKAWVVPLMMALANALVVVSIARDTLRGRRFLVFWSLYALAWTIVAWHGLHFHRPPRPAALFMNLGEIWETPLPDWREMPWSIAAVAIGLGWLARRPSPPGRDLRLATLAAVVLFAGLHVRAFLRYRTADMLRYSEYRDLVRTQGLEGAVVLDGLELLRGPDSASIFRDLRLIAASAPPTPIPVDPVAADRMVIVQLESLDREALTPEVAPNLLHLWNTTTRGLLDPLRASVSGSSSADFQLLTGLRPLTPIPVYRLAWDRDRSGLPAYAASRGFGFHAYHGNDRQFWNRGPFFSALGVDFRTSESIPETEYSRWGRADGDLFRYGAAQVRTSGRAVHFLITLSTHAPYDLVLPAAHSEGAPVKTRYLQSVGYLDAALGRFLQALPKDGTTLVALYSDHTSSLFDSDGANEEGTVPMMLGVLAPDGSLRPLARGGHPVQALPGSYELPALHQFLKGCLDASAR
jgi:hypothetical protein